MKLDKFVYLVHRSADSRHEVLATMQSLISDGDFLTPAPAGAMCFQFAAREEIRPDANSKRREEFWVQAPVREKFG